jgi:phosphoglycolate phosphatase-like HAD superfamily hydrolase
MAASGDSAILVDVDGTLVDSTYHHALAWQRAFAGVSLTVPVWRIHRCIGMGGDRLVEAVAGPDVEQRHGDDVRVAWREEYQRTRHDVVPLPGAADLIRRLADSPHRVALASSGDPEFTHDAVATLGVGDLVEVVTTADDAEASKPADDLLRTTLDRLGGVRLAVLVGDTPYDVESAARLGLRCLAVRSGGYAESELRDARAAAVVDGPDGLLELDWEQYLSAPGD